ncbi:MAG: serine O-acetyltransferase [Candidatus Goldiibacteriota bacterium]
MFSDIKTVFERDPAAGNIIEVIFMYPGLHAVINHRIAHFLWRMRIPVVPRMISAFSRFLTGIDIHPGAKIGKNFFIDHGMGVVIGETAIIGDNVLLYQGVTLGGTGKEKGKRHPTLENDIVVGAGAKVLGNITVGANTKIGAGSVVVSNVPEHSTVVGIPGVVVKRMGENLPEETLKHGDLPDPIKEAMDEMYGKIRHIENLCVRCREKDKK